LAARVRVKAKVKVKAKAKVRVRVRDLVPPFPLSSHLLRLRSSIGITSKHGIKIIVP
jgi:hypothetical protein